MTPLRGAEPDTAVYDTAVEKMRKLGRPTAGYIGKSIATCRRRAATPRAPIAPCIAAGFVEGLGEFFGMFAAGLGHVGAAAAAAADDFGGRADPFAGVHSLPPDRG